MDIFTLFSVLISLAAFFSYVNVRLFKLPTGIILILMGSIVSILLIITGQLSPSFTDFIRQKLSLINFSDFLLGILLSFLLFAGSLHVDIRALKDSAVSIVSFATVGVIISTFLIGTGVYYLLQLFGFNLPYIACLLFGALISPTDPIAVMGILKKAGIPTSMETKITGESLFNDGIGVVVFATILQIAIKGVEHFNMSSALLLFMRESAGGITAGLIIGYVGYRLMKSIDHFQTEILISLAMVMGGYSFCHYLHVSGPLAMVVAGLFTGSKSRKEAMSDTTRDYLEKFWEITNEALNAILFMLIGLELVIVDFKPLYIIIGLIAAIMLVMVRFISLWIPAYLFRFKQKLENRTLEIMTWGGLRGGISIALALSLQNKAYKDIFVEMTFVIVLFSILVQGFTMERLVTKFQTD